MIEFSEQLTLSYLRRFRHSTHLSRLVSCTAVRVVRGLGLPTGWVGLGWFGLGIGLKWHVRGNRCRPHCQSCQAIILLRENLHLHLLYCVRADNREPGARLFLF